jgi:hypothetical protein
MDSVELVLNKRLIVLVPEGLAGNLDLAKKIYQMALRDHCDVLYLAFTDHEDNLLAVSRSMATMKALTVSELVKVNSKVTLTQNWLATLQGLYRSGDSMVCHAEQTVNNGFLKTAPIRDFLTEAFKTPIYTISGHYHPWRVTSKKWLYGLLFWLGCLVILIGFSLLEIQIDREIQGVTRSALFLIVLTLEFGSFWVWNHLPKI